MGNPRNVARLTRALLQVKRGATPKEGVSDRDNPSRSRGAGETILVPRNSRKLTCEGGGVTRRDDEAPEAKS